MKKVKLLYKDFKPHSYDLYLSPDREKAVFKGSVLISGRKTSRPSQRLTFHQNGLKFTGATIKYTNKKNVITELDVERINTQNKFNEVRLHTKQPLYAGNYQIKIDFTGRITEPMHGIYPCNFELDGQKKQLIATQFESHHAREAFPCIDEPEAKAIFRLILNTPQDETVVANTPIKTQTLKNNYLLTEFEETPVMSTYLLAFAYGKLAFKESASARGVKVRVYATPDKVELTDFALNTATKCLDFFEDYYGIDYPLPKLDLLGLPDFSAGAMENWGLITFRESVLYVDPKSSPIETKQAVATVITHEIAHQWFGNLVTMKWWNDLWLNESFANLMEYRATDALYPEWSIWQDFVQREISSALNRDSLPNVQPVQVEVNHPDEILSLFDPSIVYAKGGSLLNMLMHLIGEENFRSGLNAYFKEFAYSNTVAADLWQHLGKASGLNVGKLMQNWLKKPGYPVIKVDYSLGENKFSVTQQRLVVSTQKTNDNTIWQVPLAPSLSAQKIMLTRQEGVFDIIPQDTHPLVLNHDGQSYFVVKYDNLEHFEEILKSAGRGELSPTDRLLLVQSYLLLERAGQALTIDNIKLLPALKNERDVTVWGLLGSIISNVNNLIGPDKILEDKLNNYLRPLVSPLASEVGWQSKTDDDAKTHRLRSLGLGLAAAVSDQTIIDEGLKLFKGFSKPADLDPDIRDTVYFIGVRYGSAADFNKLVKLHDSLHIADEIDEIASALTSTRQPGQIELLLKKLLDGDIRPQDVTHWYAWLMRNRYATSLAWQWLKDNWPWIEEKFGSDKSYDYFVRYSAMVLSRPEQLQDFQQFFADKVDLALERPIKLGIEEIEGRIIWRQKNESAVVSWLKSL